MSVLSGSNVRRGSALRVATRAVVERLEVRSLLAGDGLSAVYFDNAAAGGTTVKDYTGASVARIDANINFNWGTSAPASGIGADTFSVRWGGEIETIETGSYTFRTTTDDGVRLWVDGQLLVNQWVNRSVTSNTASITLEGGRRYHIVMENYDNTGAASAKLEWQRPGQSSFAVVPQAQLYSMNRSYPANAGIINAKTPFTHNSVNYTIVGDGIVDDTAAIQALINKYKSTYATLYFPAGTYRMTNGVTFGTDKFSAKQTVIQGANRDTVVFQLDDASANFQSTTSPKPVISFFDGTTTGEAFHNFFGDATIDVGKDNPGATGLRFIANNQGGVENVTIRADASSDGLRRGYRGFDSTASEVGPALVRNLLVEGFDRGIAHAGYNFGMVYEDITLQNQNPTGYALHCGEQPVTVRRLTSRNVCVGVYVNGVAQLDILDSTFTGGDPSRAAISSTGTGSGAAQIFARNIKTSGYGKAIDVTSGTDVVGPNVGEYATGTIKQFTTNASSSINLPTEDVPEPLWGDTSQWVNVVDFGASTADSGDDTAGIQAAFNSAAANGKKVVYFPKGTYRLTNTITITGGVERVFGVESWLIADPGLRDQPKSAFKFQHTSPSLTFDRVATYYDLSNTTFTWFEQNTDKTLSLQHVQLNSGKAYKNTATASNKLFIDDVVGGWWSFSNGQKVFARQMNPEGSTTGTTPQVDVNNATFWGLNLKHEGNAIKFRVSNGGKAEVIGGEVLPSTVVDATRPAYVIDNAQASFSWVHGGNGTANTHTIYVREIQGTTTKDWSRGATGFLYRGDGGFIPRYIGNTSVHPTAASMLSATATSSSVVSLAWTDNSSNETGFEIERATDAAFTQNLTLVTTTAANATTYSDTGRTGSTTYYYRVRATNASGDSANTTGIAVTTPAAATPITGVTATASGTTNGSASNLVSGAGLNSNGEHSNAPAWSTGGHWYVATSSFATQWVEFDLGAVYTVTSMKYWNSNSSGETGRGIKDFTLWAGNTANPTTQVHSGQLAQASGSSTYTGSTITFSTPFTGRCLRIKVSSIWGGAGNNQSGVGLSEIRFFS